MNTMKTTRCAVLAAALVMGVLAPVSLSAQISLPSGLIPDKATLLDQAKKLVSDLTAMKQDPKLPAADKSTVDSLLPKATAVSSELDKPQVEPSRLAQLAGQLGDLQKQYGALKGLIK
ncbi:MAG: hypothetical protein C5B48_09930 [Candidatus Rokuibacteriota bacterium]|nr:MAG: hypothetical protein C5B48_09930 [Candidatus Rokubacteria bacterium]